MKTLHEFVAMEYIYLIGNRTLKVWITPQYVFAAKVRGLTAESFPYGSTSDSPLVIDPALRYGPQNYVNSEEAERYTDFNFFAAAAPDQFTTLNSSNFVISKRHIKSCFHNPKKKWGMGDYPHDGRIIVKTQKEATNKKRKREFIIIGDQDTASILKYLNNYTSFTQ